MALSKEPYRQYWVGANGQVYSTTNPANVPAGAVTFDYQSQAINAAANFGITATPAPAPTPPPAPPTPPAATTTFTPTVYQSTGTNTAGTWGAAAATPGSAGSYFVKPASTSETPPAATAIQPPIYTAPPTSTEPSTTPSGPTESWVRIPSRDVVDFSYSPVSALEMEELFIGDVGGIELSQVTTYQTIAGTNQKYKTISGLDELNLEFDPEKMVSSQTPENSIFGKYGLQLIGKDITVEINPDTGDLEIEFDIIEANVDLDVQVAIDATIYTVDYLAT